MLDVTVVTCTCRRLAFFEKMQQSLRENLVGLDSVHEWLIIDDNSSDTDRVTMGGLLPGARFILKDEAGMGHARSLNMMLDEVRTRYVLYWEDDSVLLNRGAWLASAVELADSFPDLISVSFDAEIENDRRCAARRLWVEGKGSIPHIRYVPQDVSLYSDSSGFNYSRDLWPGFSLKPNLLNLDAARRLVGRFDERNRDHMEYDFSLRALKAGLGTAILKGPAVADIGRDQSTYVLNGQQRSYDSEEQREAWR